MESAERHPQDIPGEATDYYLKGLEDACELCRVFSEPFGPTAAFAGLTIIERDEWAAYITLEHTYISSRRLHKHEYYTDYTYECKVALNFIEAVLKAGPFPSAAKMGGF